jgi:hypothetical protein
MAVGGIVGIVGLRKYTGSVYYLRTTDKPEGEEVNGKPVQLTAKYPKHNGPPLTHILDDYTKWYKRLHNLFLRPGRLIDKEFTMFNLLNLPW